MKTKPCEDCNQLFEYKHARSVCCLECREVRRIAKQAEKYAKAKGIRKADRKKPIHPKYLHRHWKEDG